jgi:cobalt-zinc-cadmium efflux system outer membrane protein
MLSFKIPCQIRFRILIGCLAFASVACEWHLLAQTAVDAQLSVSNLNAVENRMRQKLLLSKSYYSVKNFENKPTSQLPSSSLAEQRIREKLLNQRNNRSQTKATENPTKPSLSRSNASTPEYLPSRNKTVNPYQAPNQIRPALPSNVTTLEKPSSVSPAIDFANESFTQDSSSSLTPDSLTKAPDEIQDLDSFVNYALANHPALAASTARIQATQYEALQVGLAPNPQLGLYLDEVGNNNDPGLWGAYIQRKLIRGNKRAIAREVKNREVNVREIKNEALTLSISTEVKRAFYRVLIAQEKLELATQLYNTQQQAVKQSRQLFDSGETPKTDLLQTELQAQRARVLVGEAKVIHKNSWRKLAASIGSPALTQRLIQGSFEPIAQPLSFDFWQQKTIKSSPELLAAEAEVERVRTTIDQEIAQSIPDYQTQISLGRDSNSNHFFAGVQLQVPLQICDRNQGNIAAAKSNLVAAQNRVGQIQLRLTKQLAIQFQQYELALVKINLYQSDLLPNAEKTLDLIKLGYPEEVSFLQLAIAQQTLIDLTIDYLNSIEELWKTRLKIEGLLQDNSLNF